MTREGHLVITPVLPVSRRGGEKRDEGNRTLSADDSITAWALAARAGDPAAVDHFVRALHRDVVRFVAHLSDWAKALV